MKLKNKFLIIFVILSMLLLLFNSVYASSDYSSNNPPDAVMDYLYTTEEYANKSNYNYFIFQATDGRYLINFLPKLDDLKAYLIYYSASRTNFAFNQAFEYKQYQLNSDGSFIKTTSNTSTVSSVWGMKKSNNIINWYSDFDVYTDDTYSTAFFQAPPQKVEGITIPALETAEQIPEAIATTLKILIPVGLIVLSIGLGIYLIKRVKSSIM